MNNSSPWLSAEHVAMVDLITTIIGTNATYLGIREGAVYAKKRFERMRTTAAADLNDLKREWSEHKASCGRAVGIQDEPPAKSVVIDCDGDAWQSDPFNSGEWFAILNRDMATNWSQLSSRYGPLTLVWSPPDESSNP